MSAVALDRAAAHAAARGAVTRKSTGSSEDLLHLKCRPRAVRPGDGPVHAPAAEPGEDVTARLAAAVRPGGTLLIVAHHPDDLHVNVGR